MTIEKDSKDIRIKGYIGKWYVIETKQYSGKDLFLLEHQTYGGDAACIIVDSDGKVILDETYNGFEDLDYEIEEGLTVIEPETLAEIVQDRKTREEEANKFHNDRVELYSALRNAQRNHNVDQANTIAKSIEMLEEKFYSKKEGR